MSRLRRILTATLVVATLPVAGASADVAGPDDSLAEAFGPLAADKLYSGRFVGRPLRGLTVRLEGTRARTVAVRRLRSVGAGERTVTLRLDAVTRRTLSRRGRLALRLRIVATPVSGAPQTARRSVLFLRR